MEAKKRLQQRPLVSRLQIKPEDTDIPHMVKGKFVKPEQTSSTEEDKRSLFFPAETPPDLRTAVYKADTARKCKIKTKEGKMGFEYVFSRIHKENENVKSVTDQPKKMTDWDQCRTSEYSEMKDMTIDKLSEIPFHEESDMSAETPSESEDKNEMSEVQTVSTQMSCHRRACMKFHRFLRQKKAPPSYDKTEPIHDDVMLHILRLREKLGWQTSLPPHGFKAEQRDFVNIYKITLPEPLQEDDGEYVYCLIRSRDDPKAAYDPYDLQVVSADLARQSKEYWTITATYVSKFTLKCGKEEMEITPVMEWLYERQLYYALRNIDFCFKFRLMKYFIIWQNNVKRTKIKKSKMEMYDHLFIADEILQKCLLYIHALCIDVSSSERHTTSEDIVINFIKIDTSYTYTLDEFCKKQYQQSQHALSQIHAFKDKVIQVIQNSFLKVAEMKGVEKIFQHLSDDTKEKPQYFEIAEWRHIMEKFSCFVQLVDRIFQELLRRLVHNALNLLLEIFRGSSSMKIPKQKTNDNLIRLFKNTIERANDLVTENRCMWMFQDNYFQVPQESLHCSKEPEAPHEIITVGDIDKILEEVKRRLKGEEEYSPVFEVNICLRIPYEKDYRRKFYQDDDNYIAELEPESFREHDEDLKKLSQNDKRKKCEDESGTAEQDSESNNEPLMYTSSPRFSTDIYLIPNRREFSIKMQGILDGLENTIGHGQV